MVGGGIGQVQAELLGRGAASGRVVEVACGYEGAAAELAPCCRGHGASLVVSQNLSTSHPLRIK